MRRTSRKGLAKLTLLVSLLIGALALSPAAFAKPKFPSVSGAVFTTVNTVVDGTGHCGNATGVINCNIYRAKKYVWLNGGPITNHLSPAGKYFFVVLAPGGQNDVADKSAKNLSCPPSLSPCADPYTNRTFTIGTTGEITSYTGTHDQSPATGGGGGLLLRLCLAGCPPYIDTPNPGGEYIMGVCYLGPLGTTYPPDPKSCKYDAFKVRARETVPPTCSLIATISGPPKSIQVMVQDTGSGIQSIQVTKSTNALTVVPPFTPGTTSPVVVTSTKIIQSMSSVLALKITDVDGNVTICDPVVPGTKAMHRQLRRSLIRSSVSRVGATLAELFMKD